MFVGNQQQKKQNKFIVRKRKGQDATKITSGPARVMHPISLVSDADFDDSTDVEGEKHPQSKHH